MEKIKLMCDDCGTECIIVHNKLDDIQYCPCCGSEDVSVIYADEEQLNGFGDLEDFDEYED